MKLIKLRYINKDGKLKEMEIADNTIKRIVRPKRVVTIVTPLRGRGFKNQTVQLNKDNFDFLMNQLDG